MNLNHRLIAIFMMAIAFGFGMLLDASSKSSHSKKIVLFVLLAGMAYCTTEIKEYVIMESGKVKSIATFAKNSTILTAALIAPYVMAYGSTLLNTQINKVVFDIGSGRYVIGLFIIFLNPLLFTLIDISAICLLRAKNMWKYAIPIVCVLHLVMMPLIWTSILPNVLTLKMMHTQHSGFLSMFILNNFILLWLAFYEIRAGGKSK